MGAGGVLFMAGFHSIALAGLELTGLEEEAVLELRDPPDSAF